MVCVRQCCAAAWLVVCLSASAGVSAQGTQAPDIQVSTRPVMSQPGVYFDAVALRSDNIYRTPDARRSGEVASLGTAVDLIRQGGWLHYDLIGDLQWNRYLHATYPAKLLGFFDGSTVIGIVPGRFEWTAHETYSQLSGDPLQPVTPDTLVAANSFSTGPRLSVHPSVLTTLSLSGEYGKTSTGAGYVVNTVKTDLNNSRYLGTAALQRALSAATVIALTGSHQRVRFDSRDLSSADYDSNSAYASYETSSVRTHLLMTGGYKEVDLGPSGRKFRTPTGRLEVVRQISATSTVAFSAFQQLEEALELRSSDVRALTGEPVATRIFQPAPFLDRTVGAAWTYTRDRHTFALTANWSSEKSDFDPRFNRRVISGELRYRRQLRPTVSLNVRGGFFRDRYTVLGVRDEDWHCQAGLAFEPGLRQSVILGYEYFDRRSSLAGVAFRETRIGLEFVHRIL